MASWLFGWGKGKQKQKAYLGDGDPGFHHVSEPSQDHGSFAVSEARERPEEADRGASRIVKIPSGQYQALPQFARGLKGFDLSSDSKDCQGRRCIDIETAISTDENDTTTFRPVMQAGSSSEDTHLIYESEMVWMEAKQGAQDCMIFTTTFDLTQGEKQTKVYFPHELTTEVEVEHWINGFRFNTEGGEQEPYECDCWETHLNPKGFMAHASGSKKLERLDVTWIVYKKGKKKVASGTFGTQDIEDREEGEAENTGRIEFAQGQFSSTPTVLVGISQFEIAGGRDLRLDVHAGGVSSTGFTWRLDTWGEDAQGTLQSVEGTWIALGFG
ncbi:hypothetical protein KC340_g15440 [Hortaea werneckii]|nr:hypothetical protein KC342_g15831 [Hortaea werneckii]KAI7062586.1 hypothetical protein KC339_g16515 [Hortaea werneckii]KAI7213200.1 hypothetical protein KC365_g14349 [Hortaea werneckii]KAI7296374.1 hypothetical protein KC340_g15440 [Hortaea werneckii]KAI7382013.1 hypothetical protein KC328_g11916 [Hortaea werneckii]